MAPAVTTSTTGCASVTSIEAGAPRGVVRAAGGQSPGGAHQRRRRRDPRAGDAPRPGGRALAAAGVVAARRSRRRRAPVRGGGQRTARASCPTRTASSATAGPTAGDTGFDVTGRLTADVIDAGGVPTAEADFYLCGPGPFMHDIAAALTARGVRARPRQRRRCSGPESPRRPASSAPRRARPHPADGRAGRRPGDLVQPQQPVGGVGSVLREPARVRRGLRRPGPVVVPDRRLPHLRDRAHQRRGQLPARPARAARARARR